MAYLVKGERWIGAGWPEGPYLIQLLRAKKCRTRDDEHDAMDTAWALVGTDVRLSWFLTDSPRGRFFWSDWAESLEDIELGAGFELIALLKKDQVGRRETMTISAAIATVTR